MRKVVRLCPCGGEIIPSNDPPAGLTCRSCGAIFAEAGPLVMVTRGRDDSLIEGTFAKITTQQVSNEQPRTDAPTVR